MPPLFLPKHPENQAPMARYMRDQFQFLGVRSTERRELLRPISRQSKTLDEKTLQDWLAFYYQQPYREYQYVAIDLAFANIKRLTPQQYQWCYQQVTVTPWWDSVDAWRKVLSTYVFKQDALEELGPAFLTADNLWLRRISIILQLGRKMQTDEDYLRTAILNNQSNDEFFIQKAIGWALRDYSKTNPEWVREFFATVPLSKLAQREGQKYLPAQQ
ncbi:DNA alkylation repair protein [Lactiplantibacillus herbarum]|uniref:DNA alkylation repair protein n=1 Tax=Lactiplantibacillus herbarum TaxID=1670446 RepID=UPI00064FDA7D|nr:DNA alkylation repair protein [Lactiplantibacillus herbarum]